MKANHPWWPSQGSVSCLSTAPISAIRIVGSSTRKPQKMNACISPGPNRWSSLRWPSTIVTSLRARRLGSSLRLTGGAAWTSAVRNNTRRMNSVPLVAIAAARATAAMTVPMSLAPS